MAVGKGGRNRNGIALQPFPLNTCIGIFVQVKWIDLQVEIISLRHILLFILFRMNGLKVHPEKKIAVEMFSYAAPE